MAEIIPVSCEVMTQMAGDGKNPDQVAAALYEGISDEDAQKALGDLGFDSLDAVELTMIVEDCKSCDAKGEGCRIGSFLVRLDESTS